MAQLVVNGAQIKCTFGDAPVPLTVVPAGVPVKIGKQFGATVMDHKPTVNIAPLGMCKTLSNPQVAAATSAAMGTLTPQPCIPVTTQPWQPGSAQVKIGNFAALTSASTCMCQWGGTISVVSPGQTTTTAT